jgi:hypothetical protein
MAKKVGAFQCEHGCGFRGSYEEVVDHAQRCASRTPWPAEAPSEGELKSRDTLETDLVTALNRWAAGYGPAAVAGHRNAYRKYGVLKTIMQNFEKLFSGDSSHAVEQRNIYEERYRGILNDLIKYHEPNPVNGISRGVDQLLGYYEQQIHLFQELYDAAETQAKSGAPAPEPDVGAEPEPESAKRSGSDGT